MPGRAAARPAHPLAKLGVHLDGKAERARIPSHPLAMQNGNMSGRDKMRIFPFWLTVTVLGVALLALRSAVPVWATITGSPFSYGGVTWCQSYHAYNGCNNVQSPSQYTVSFDPAQDSLNGSAVWLAMNSAATRSGAVNTWGNQTWTLPFTLTEQISLPCNSSNLIENWPAFWTVGSSGTWPANGETDIVEAIKGEATWDYHYVNPAGVADDRAGAPAGNWCGTHIYPVIETTSAVTFIWDGEQVGQVTPAEIGVPISAVPQYAVGDYGAGSSGGPTTAGAVMKVLSFVAS